MYNHIICIARPHFTSQDKSADIIISVIDRSTMAMQIATNRVTAPDVFTNPRARQARQPRPRPVPKPRTANLSNAKKLHRVVIESSKPSNIASENTFNPAAPASIRQAAAAATTPSGHQPARRPSGKTCRHAQHHSQPEHAPRNNPRRARRWERRESRGRAHLRRVDGGARREVDPPTRRRRGGEGDAGAERSGGGRWR